MKNIVMKTCSLFTGKVFRRILVLLLIPSIFSGCAASVALDVLHPAEVNMSQYRTIGVYEFSEYESSKFSNSGYILFNLLLGDSVHTGYSNSLASEVADYVTDIVTDGLEETDYFRVISPGQLKQVFRSQRETIYQGQLLKDQFGIEALIIGAVEDMDFDEYTVVETEGIWDAEIEEYVETDVEYFVQEAELTVSYSAAAVEDGKILASKRLSGEKRRRTALPLDEEEKEHFNAPSLFSLYREIANEFVPEIQNQLAPRFEREYRTLEKDKNKNPEMDAAEEFVKNKQYQKALDIYTQVWYKNRNFAAGYNAAIMFEVMGKMDDAVTMMKEVYSETQERKAYSAYNRLVRRREEYNKAREQIDL
ncbi:MAG: hypothetical protein K9K80_01915 [Spirochaetia bacterium]|nr:hypothetical protein [Spirochaetia bacterium]MCF7952930.1 hypothetical protein [Spirochaetales bacterium]